jgi:hypothetical protein
MDPQIARRQVTGTYDSLTEINRADEESRDLYNFEVTATSDDTVIAFEGEVTNRAPIQR